jgi:hypothetical protein
MNLPHAETQRRTLAWAGFPTFRCEAAFRRVQSVRRAERKLKENIFLSLMLFRKHRFKGKQKIDYPELTGS